MLAHPDGAPVREYAPQRSGPAGPGRAGGAAHPDTDELTLLYASSFLYGAGVGQVHPLSSTAAGRRARGSAGTRGRMSW